MWKFIKYSLLVIVVAATVLVVNAIWFKPFSMRVFYDRVMLETAMDSPQLLTQLRILEGFGIRGHNAELGDLSPESTTESYAKMRENYKMFQSYGRDGREGQDLISYDIFDNFMGHSLEGEKWRWHGYPVNQLFGVHTNLPSFLSDMHQVNDATDAEYYISRLNAVDSYFEGLMVDLAIREEKGILPPTFVVEAVIAQMENFTSSEPAENVLVSSFVRKLESIELTEQERNAFIEQAEQAVAEVVYPAYAGLQGYFVGVLPQTNNDAGVWKLPDGDAYYRYQLKQYTTTDITADEVHQLGLSEVARIHAEMRDIFDDLGYPSDVAIGTLLQQLNEDPQFLYPDTDAGREQILKDYALIVDDIYTYIDPAFRMRPEADLEVVRVPTYAEKNAPGAYYQRPALDGSRPGRFFANLYDIKATPKYGMKTLTVHEGVPGHHFQIALQQEMTGLPLFRSFLPYSVHTEGWALYTEQLMADLGFYNDDPYGDIGRLQAELFRAIRLVVDTGIHAKRWTREEAIDYMASNGGMTMSDVVSEIERYIVMPGQATSYKMGMLKFVELRAKARDTLGSRFDIRDFHDVILKNGSMPLPILERLIDNYIAEKLAANTEEAAVES
ncbi:DUF885 domain-containing protein [Pseudidiomarina aestuarii]|uniref:DUF885 domain-containing protein n=1 Tax=Pseudidiomarina aestuarii TaxID=624146 RepID=A0A7Z6ZUL4_9GAMM|nr:DUF885 domain-containing protein [Pseudidiomarina aestuarii]RUO41567.1 DUF885 domain-containing protein [Pseudidiomarina aestuarii]